MNGCISTIITLSGFSSGQIETTIIQPSKPNIASVTHKDRLVLLPSHCLEAQTARGAQSKRHYFHLSRPHRSHYCCSHYCCCRSHYFQGIAVVRLHRSRSAAVAPPCSPVGSAAAQSAPAERQSRAAPPAAAGRPASLEQQFE